MSEQIIPHDTGKTWLRMRKLKGVLPVLEDMGNGAPDVLAKSISLHTMPHETLTTRHAIRSLNVSSNMVDLLLLLLER